MHSVPPLKDPSLLVNKAYVNGSPTTASSGVTFEVHDPATGKLVETCPDMDGQDVRQAITVAQTAFASFRHLTPRQRSIILRDWYNLMIDNADDLATLITWENGKPLKDAYTEVSYAANFLSWFSEEAPRIYGDTIQTSNPNNRLVTWKEPVGVCGIITPWNFPAAMVTRKVGAALAAGCTVVAKSPGETPLTPNALAVLAKRAGIPDGVVNIISSLKNTVEVGEVLTTDPRIKKVSFTGSTMVGKLLMKQASMTVKKVSMELGGNAPFIVFNDCDLGLAIDGAVASKFRGTGQTCVCANRIYVQKGIYKSFLEAFTTRVRELKVSPGFAKDASYGPLIHDRAVAKVESHVKDAQKKGAALLVGGERLPALGPNFYAPTVLAEVTKEMAISSEETFGPVAGIFCFETEKEVIALANDTSVGLAGYFYSNNMARIYRVAEALEVGMIGVNTGLISDAAAPFGGVKESGLGREGSKYGIDDYLVVKTMTLGGISRELEG